MDFSFRVRLRGLKALKAEDVCEGFGADDPGSRKFSSGLGTKGVPIDNKTYPAKAFRGQKAVQHRNGELGFACARRHCEQHVPAPIGQFRFNLLDCKALIGSQRKAKIKGSCLQILRCTIDVNFKSPEEAI